MSSSSSLLTTIFSSPSFPRPASPSTPRRCSPRDLLPLFQLQNPRDSLLSSHSRQTHLPPPLLQALPPAGPPLRLEIDPHPSTFGLPSLLRPQGRPPSRQGQAWKARRARVEELSPGQERCPPLRSAKDCFSVNLKDDTCSTPTFSLSTSHLVQIYLAPASSRVFVSSSRAGGSSPARVPTFPHVAGADVAAYSSISRVLIADGGRISISLCGNFLLLPALDLFLRRVDLARLEQTRTQIARPSRTRFLSLKPLRFP